MGHEAEGLDSSREAGDCFGKAAGEENGGYMQNAPD